MDSEQAVQFLERIFASYDTYICFDSKLEPLPCLLLATFDEFVYEQMPVKQRQVLVKNCIQTLAAAENDSIFLAANKLFKKCTIDCQPLVELLLKMMQPGVAETSMPKRRSKANTATAISCTAASKIDVSSSCWKQGIAMLELLENKKQLNQPEKLIPGLFSLLQLCLDFEEQAAVEYTKQLTLSALLHTCRLAQAAGVVLQSSLPKSTFRIDQIVECMRVTKNPQTHHNALLLLSHCAELFPQQVLHNIVDIFTFMGSSVVRHDDAFSFHIINNITESIIPILVKSSDGRKSLNANENNVNPLVVPVLKVFSDIMLDVPEHRRLPLYSKLLQTLSVS